MQIGPRPTINYYVINIRGVASGQPNFGAEHPLPQNPGYAPDHYTLYQSLYTGWPKIAHQINTKNKIKERRRSTWLEVANEIRESLTSPMQLATDLAREKGASSWLTALPLEDGFWRSSFERAFFDVRVFNPFAPSNRHSSLSASYRHHENLKKRDYEQRIREVEHSSFTPLVFATTGAWPWPSSCSLLQTPSWPASSRTNGSNHTAPQLAG